MQESKTGKEEKVTIANRDVNVPEGKRLDAVKRNFAIGIERFGIAQSDENTPVRFKNHVSKN